MRVLEGQLESRRTTRVVARGCPFADVIVREPLPGNFKSAKVKDYDGNANPEEHLARFENMAMLHCYIDRIKCKVFLTTLVDSAQRWFEGLPPQSVHSFRDFQKVFLHYFSSSKKYKKTAFSLFEVKQSPEESLRAYIKRFNRVALDVPSCAAETKTTAFTHGNFVAPSLPRPINNAQMPRLPPWTPRQLGSSFRGRGIRNSSRIEPGRRRRPEPEQRKKSPPVIGTIKMISGGSTDGNSNRARKSKSRRECLEVERAGRSEVAISFGPEDLRGVNLPHNDALVIQARVANYDILLIFVDSGSSVNVIFKDSFMQMDLQGYHLETVETALFGFAGHVVYPEGEIILPLTLGSHDLKKTVMTSFTVVDPPSSYNINLGRPAMNELRAVASTYHQKIKFPVGSRVGEVRRDQPSSQKCYVEAVRADQGRSKREGKRAKVDEARGRIVEEGEIHFVAEEEQEAVEIGPGQQIRVARDLDISTRVSLIKCLKTNIRLFAWSQQELTGISPFISEHHLNILPGSHPVKEKKRHFGPQKDKVISEQVKELLKAGHIREIQFPTWLSNVVLVPKSTGKWRMCVDFRDLNKACPKDHYPLPRIDQLVDSTSGYELMSFMDAYQGYHQIPLAKSDQDKASFVTSGGTFCYIVMPFGLKKAGATYQRLMDKVFEKQLGRNVEVYVDDILGKTREFTSFINDLEETFATLMQHGIKLNPAKCIFGVKSGKFLGFMVTERGIEAQKFGWNDKCEQAFQDLKAHLAELRILVKPEPGEKLFLYLSTTEHAVSSVLIKEEGFDQRPVYYVSHALRGPEIRYTEVEKIALALIVTARKLRPYFLSHQIVVLTNSPLGRIMTHSEVSGRMIKWTIELGEHDIEYKPRVAIKAQALSDFLSEMIQPNKEEVWRVFVDGASSLAGCGVGVVIISPLGEKIKLASRIDSRVTNNEAEYEAVLAGIRAAREVNASRIILYSDSQLITQQIKGVYEAKEDRMVKYLQLIKARAEVFTDWNIEQIPREENSEADTLAKMAASLSEINTREVLHVSRLILSTEEEMAPDPKDSWMTPWMRFIERDELPGDRTQAQKIKRQAPRFVLLNTILYRRSF
ncbi:uncharacterized protein [Primulina eburnea]|uniref:uncharacterized protein n=1 Tax=Primulina eburnea TaxID=1245227 RepID=UPI003C6BFD4D